MSTLRSSAGLFTFESGSLLVESADGISDFDLLSGELATILQKKGKKQRTTIFFISKF